MIRVPITIAEGLDVKLYATVEDAELDLEPVDVAEGRFKGYDAEGRRLLIETGGSAVKISAAEERPRHQQEWKELLLEALARAGQGLGQGSGEDEVLAASQIFLFRPPRTFWEMVKDFWRRR